MSRLSDKETIKAFECCYLYDVMFCDKCPNKDTCGEIDVAESTLDLINRQQAEIAELKEKNAGLALSLLYEVVNKDEQLRNEITKVAKSEARKEFAERLKERLLKGSVGYCIEIENDIDDVLKEMG